MRPIIGLTIYDDLSKKNLPIAVINIAYISSIREAGGVPILIPNQLTEAEWRDLYPHLNGLLFTGGGDINVDLFNGSLHPKVDEVSDERDTLEFAILRQTVQDGKPFLGICRGCQVVNVALGGTLYTHIPDQLPGAIKHDWYPDIPRNAIAHPVRIEEGSQSAGIFGEPVLQVNSLHHQGIEILASGITAVGHAPDGLVEAVELPDHPFGVAVQWHPEWLTGQKEMRRLFSAFVEAASR